MAPHSSTLAWKIPWMEEPGGLQSMGLLESDTTERLHFHFSLSCIGEGNGNTLQCSCLENPRDGGAWWAAVSRTQLKRLTAAAAAAGFCKFSSRAQTNETATSDCNFCLAIWPSTSHPTILSFLAEAWPMVGHADQNDICCGVEPCPAGSSARVLHDRETSTLQANQAHLGVSLSIQP